MIRQGEFKHVPQRLICYYILFDFRAEQCESPFIPFLVAVSEQKNNLKNLKFEKIETNFINFLLSNGAKDFLKLTPTQILKSELLQKQVEVNIASIEQKFEQFLIDVPKVDLCEVIDIKNEDNSETEKIIPEFITVAPPLLDDLENELVWINYTDYSYFKPIYDTSNEIGLKAKNLLELAFIQTIALTDQHVLLEELKKDPDLVYQIGLAPERVSFSIFYF